MGSKSSIATFGDHSGTKARRESTEWELEYIIVELEML